MSPKIVLLALLVPAGALAQNSTPVPGAGPAHGPGNVFYQRFATDQADPPPPPDPKLQAQLDAAQQRLEKAAREVADLSAQLGGPIVRSFSTFNDEFGRALIGVQLDTTGGKDGARVLSVSPGGPAAEAGIRPGDVIVALNGTEVKGEDAPRQAVKILRDVKPDSKVNVRVLREGTTKDFTVTARPGPGFMAFARGFPPMPPMALANVGKPFFMVQGPLSSMELASLTPQLGKYFGTDKGVLVVRAPPDGALKLEDGDVILSIDGREPTSGSHATRILGSYQPGEKISLRIIRQHKNMDLETTVPDELPLGPRKGLFLRGGGEVTAPVPPDGVVLRHRDDEI
jgi:predicted metalloprotease with PDZ domain